MKNSPSIKCFNKFDEIYNGAKSNAWYKLFYDFCRFSLALGFFIAGMVKIMGERFASGLSEIHPMGSYLTALHHTGFYYTFIGIAQVIAAILLLFRKTTLLGAMLYFPIIVNIWILSVAVRFEGSYVSSFLMVMANIFLLLWHLDQLIKLFPSSNYLPKTSFRNSKFPYGFAGFVIGTVGLILIIFQYGYDVMPKNSYADCILQFENENISGIEFCTCIHIQGNPLSQCIDIHSLSVKQ